MQWQYLGMLVQAFHAPEPTMQELERLVQSSIHMKNPQI